MVIIKLLEKELVGKKIRYCKSSRNVIQPYIEYVKKSNNVTNKQFESGNPKYRMIAERQKVIGKHEIFETGIVSSIDLYGDNYNDVFVRLSFTNGDFVYKELYEEIEFEN